MRKSLTLPSRPNDLEVEIGKKRIKQYHGISVVVNTYRVV